MSESYRLQVGEIACFVLADGWAQYGMAQAAARFPSVSADKLRQAFLDNGENPDALLTYYNPLLIQTDERTILVDSGESASRHDHAGNTPQCLDQLGIAPTTIDTVIITHAHGDHVVGLIDENGNLRYPNARYLINSAEWDHWMHRETPTRELLKRLESNVAFVTAGEEIADGVTVVDAYGHTPGHICLMIESQGERLFHGVDIVHVQVQFANPDWSIRFDSDPAQARATRHHLFSQLANDETLTLFYHLPFPGVGYVRPQAATFAWEPLS